MFNFIFFINYLELLWFKRLEQGESKNPKTCAKREDIYRLIDKNF